ncbi:hypothetical protein FSP39_017663 [Pinctada imbricata]|uniref:Uncharacterized protein n=3 Tax=Pinctada imbricata TaxID=66713 RepID=A0AA88Y522_PINIB|nr:hypothetical protein FSP39_017663 [Pinctada imbricata]
MSKRKQPEIVSPPLITRFTRRRILSASMSVSPKDKAPQTEGTLPVIVQSDPGSATEPIPTHPSTDTLPTIYMPHMGGNIDLTNVVINLLSNPLFTNAISTVLSPMLSQSLTSDVKNVVNDAVQNAFKSLTDQIENETCRIDSNEMKIAELTDENNELRNRVDRAESRVEEVNARIEELEQYGRRNSLRFHNVQVADPNDTDSVVVQICKDKLNVDITPDDICRSHVVGRPNRAGKSQIICRLRNWKVKNRIYSQKKKLKNDQSRIFVTEDLTRYRQAVVSEVVKAKRAEKVTSFWTNDGRIFIKTSEGGQKFLIESIDDLNYYAPPSNEFAMEVGQSHSSDARQ